MADPTNPIYKFVKNLDGNVFAVKCEQSPFTKTIPFDNDNTDYQAYLAWVDEGNTAEAAD